MFSQTPLDVWRFNLQIVYYVWQYPYRQEKLLYRVMHLVPNYKFELTN